jgi:Zn-dependent protease
MPEKPRQELLVAIAGPLVNVVIALLLMAGFGIGLERINAFDFDTATLAERLLIVNVVLVLFNMVPAFPMDGGRVLRALLATFDLRLPPRLDRALRRGRRSQIEGALFGCFVAQLALPEFSTCSSETPALSPK